MGDTLMYFKKLEAAGFSRKQAEAQVEMVSDYYNQNVATKADIQLVKVDILQLELKLSKEIQDLRHDIQMMEGRLIIRLAGITGGMILAGFSIFGAILKFA